MVSIPAPSETGVAARVWRIDVGRIPLLLLDTSLEANSEHDRGITDRLYGGDRHHRFSIRRWCWGGVGWRPTGLAGVADSQGSIT